MRAVKGLPGEPGEGGHRPGEVATTGGKAAVAQNSGRQVAPGREISVRARAAPGRIFPLQPHLAPGYDAPMTADELRKIRKALGLTQPALAARLGVHPVTVARWEISTRRIPEPTARLIRLLLAEQRKAKGRKK